MIDRVVTTLDGSHRAELAVPYAAYVGAMLGAKMELLAVSDKAGQNVVDLDSSVQRSLAEAEGLMSTWIRNIETNVASGDPAEAIVNHADDSSTLVAMATHGRTGVMRKIAGSVAEGVLRETRSPLLLVKAQDDSANIRLPARISHVIVPMDVTGVAEGALPLARLLAEKMNAGVTLLHVGDSTEAPDYMNGAADHFAGLKGEVEKEFRTGDPGKEIVDFANKVPAPLIVMCSKQANVSSGPIRGSVTDYVIRHSAVPVAVVPWSTAGAAS